MPRRRRLQQQSKEHRFRHQAALKSPTRTLFMASSIRLLPQRALFCHLPDCHYYRARPSRSHSEMSPSPQGRRLSWRSGRLRFRYRCCVTHAHCRQLHTRRASTDSNPASTASLQPLTRFSGSGRVPEGRSWIVGAMNEHCHQCVCCRGCSDM